MKGKQFLASLLVGTAIVCMVSPSAHAQGLECVVSVSPDELSFGPSGGTADVTVTTSAPTCSWTASSDVRWITIVSGGQGVGSGTLSITAGPYPEEITHIGSVSVGALRVRVTQYGIHRFGQAGSTLALMDSP